MLSESRYRGTVSEAYVVRKKTNMAWQSGNSKPPIAHMLKTEPPNTNPKRYFDMLSMYQVCQMSTMRRSAK